jgi:hypothetical protein
MAQRTMYLSRLIGLYFILAIPAMMIHRREMVEAVAGFFHDPPLLLITGVITLLAGLAMVLGHNIWSGGAQVVVVTLVGWMSLIKALLFLFLPAQVEGDYIVGLFSHPRLFYLCMAPSLAIGIYLTCSGFKPKSRT